MDRQTPVKILPCPKFRLRAVKIHLKQTFNILLVKNNLSETSKCLGPAEGLDICPPGEGEGGRDPLRIVFQIDNQTKIYCFFHMFILQAFLILLV